MMRLRPLVSRPLPVSRNMTLLFGMPIDLVDRDLPALSPSQIAWPGAYGPLAQLVRVGLGIAMH